MPSTIPSTAEELRQLSFTPSTTEGTKKSKDQKPAILSNNSTYCPLRTTQGNWPSGDQQAYEVTFRFEVNAKNPDTWNSFNVNYLTFNESFTPWKHWNLWKGQTYRLFYPTLAPWCWSNCYRRSLCLGLKEEHAVSRRGSSKSQDSLKKQGCARAVNKKMGNSSVPDPEETTLQMRT